MSGSEQTESEGEEMSTLPKKLGQKSELERIATALESLAKSAELLAHPMIIVKDAAELNKKPPGCDCEGEVCKDWVGCRL